MQKKQIRNVPGQDHRLGFTLIEILVVVAIIGILASILFPVFSRARENARRSSCMSNLKQIGLGFMQYVQDNDEKYPPPINPDPSAAVTEPGWPGRKFTVRNQSSGAIYPDAPSWMDFIFAYVKSTQIFVCPSPSFNASATFYGGSGYGYSGGFSGYNIASYGVGTNGIPATLSMVQRPTEGIMVMDGNTAYTWAMTPAGYRNSAAGADYRVVAPHLEGGNTLYADGHVKWRPRAHMLATPSTNLTCPANPTATQIATYNYCDRNWNPFRTFN